VKRSFVGLAAAFLGTAAAEAAPCPAGAPEAATLRRVGHWELTNATGSWEKLEGPSIKTTADLYVTRSAPVSACVRIAVSSRNGPACAAFEIVAPGNKVTFTLEACSTSAPLFEALAIGGAVEAARWRFQPQDRSASPVFSGLRYFAEDLALTGVASTTVGASTVATR
jgi:hypothetical protein